MKVHLAILYGSRVMGNFRKLIGDGHFANWLEKDTSQTGWGRTHRVTVIIVHTPKVDLLCRLTFYGSCNYDMRTLCVDALGRGRCTNRMCNVH